jgi:hypothetical protein
MSKRHKPIDNTKIFKEMKGRNDRAVILVAAALLENDLEECIASRFREPKTDPEKNALFGDRGILHTFSEKIWAAYFLKLIGPVTRHNLDMIRLIRNEAAHNMNPISFRRTPAIANRCRELQTLPKEMDFLTMRTRFMFFAHTLSGALRLRMLEVSSPLPPAVKKAIKKKLGRLVRDLLDD